ncbi:MAG TPA: redoxin family protein [Candidatus Paceibacterota bacterium]
MILLLISFVAGVLTVLAPCVLSLLPVIVGGSLAGGGRRRALTIVVSLGVSVILFTLLLKVSSALISVPPGAWQWLSGGILVLFGLTMLFPRLWDSLGFVNLLNRSSNQLLASGYQRSSFWGDALMGAALGPVFTSCSPTYFVILATVLPASFAMGFADLLAYTLGLCGFLFIIALVGQRLVDKLGVTIEPGGWFRRGIGILFIVVGVLVFTGTMARVELWLLERGFDVTMIEQRLLKDTAPTPAQCTTQECVGTSTASLSAEMKAGAYAKAPELKGIDGYINTLGQPITIEQFRGKKVVLIDIWTYSCINCQRTLPYLNMWYDTYHDQGLEIIGVHTPEFAFEKVLQNVQHAVNKEGIKYPVVLDNEYATWNAFGNQFWPRKYLIDIDGYIVYDHAGEGNYDEAERAIQKALAERAVRLNLNVSMPATERTAPVGAVAVDQSELGSPEVYFGAARNEYLGNGAQRKVGEQTLTLPSALRANTLYLGGVWSMSEEYAMNTAAGAKIRFVYKAKNVYFVAAASGAVKITITRDGGQPLGSARGADVGVGGEVEIEANRLYHLIGDSAYGIHTLEIEIQAPGLQAYTFTFG